MGGRRPKRCTNELLTPAKARYFLRNNHTGRRIRKSTVARYAADMRAGNWRGASMLIVGSEGELYDGQHRCEAVILADAAVQCVFFHGAVAADAVAVDQGTIRSVRQAAESLGVTMSRMGACLTRFLSSHSRKQSAHMLTAFYVKHEAAILFAEEAVPRTKQISKAPAMGAWACAYYHAPHDELLRAGRVLTQGAADDGIVTQGDRSIIMLARYLFEQTQTGGSHGSFVFQRAKRALAAFLRGGKLRSLGTGKCDDFPFPDKEDQESCP